MLIRYHFEKLNSLFFGMIGALVILLFAHLLTIPDKRIGTVNITGLVNQYIQMEATKNLPPEILKQHIKMFGNQLEKELKQLSTKKNMVLLPSEAVIAGSIDETGFIKEQVFKGLTNV